MSFYTVEFVLQNCWSNSNKKYLELKKNENKDIVRHKDSGSIAQSVLNEV